MTTLRLISETQRIEIDSSPRGFAIVSAGPPGPAGPPGQNGQAIAYEHIQAVASSSWVINHNLNFRPNITVEEAITGDEIMCGIIHHSITQLELQFNTPRAGMAYLS